MKKRILLSALLVNACFCFAQVQKQTMGTKQNVVIAANAFGADSALYIPTFSDTSLASKASKFFDGSLIKAAGVLYIRNLGSWKTVGSGGSSDAIWKLTGNVNTDPATNFIGTRDLKDLVFKVNNMLAATYKAATGGYEGPNSISTGSYSHSSSGATATGANSSGSSEGTANGEYSNAAAGGVANGNYSNAVNGALASGDYSDASTSGVATGDYSHASTGGTANGQNSSASTVGNSNGNNSSATTGGIADGAYSVASTYSKTVGDTSFASTSGTANGNHSSASTGGITNNRYANATTAGNANGFYSNASTLGTAVGSWSEASTGGRANGNHSFASTGGVANGNYANASTSGGADGDHSNASSGGQANGSFSNATSGGGSNGQYSNAMAGGSAYGGFSNASGLGVSAQGYSNNAFGAYNDVTTVQNSGAFDLGNKAFEVGIGLSSNARKNAITILYNGRMGVGTVLPDSTFHIIGGIKIVTGRQQAGYVLTSDASGGADWKAIYVTGTGSPATPPTKIGDQYIDTAAKKIYYAVGTSSAADWMILN